jgi:hypothetical protein
MLIERGLTYRQARRALEAKAIPLAKHHLHTQARWWLHEVEEFDVLAFLQTVTHHAPGSRELTQTTRLPRA